MEAIYFHHNDHLGTPQAMTDINGTKVWEMSQTPFGVATVNEDVDGDGTTVTNNFRFPGQYYDSETGLNYNYYRTYDPAIGAYPQHDPIGLNGGMNPFGYVGGNPVSLIDPLGLAAFVAARDLANGIFIGTHQFFILVPDHPEAFSGYQLKNLGNGKCGIVVGAHNVNSRLKVKYFQSADYQATNEYFNPQKYTSLFSADFDTEVSLIRDPKGRSDTDLIMAILRAATAYSRNEQARPITYPTSGFGKNSNSWVQSLIRAIGVNAKQDFSGFDIFKGGRIPEEYFR